MSACTSHPFLLRPGFQIDGFRSSLESLIAATIAETHPVVRARLTFHLRLISRPPFQLARSRAEIDSSMMKLERSLAFLVPRHARHNCRQRERDRAEITRGSRSSLISPLALQPRPRFLDRDFRLNAAPAIRFSSKCKRNAPTERTGTKERGKERRRHACGCVREENSAANQITRN